MPRGAWRTSICVVRSRYNGPIVIVNGNLQGQALAVCESGRVHFNPDASGECPYAGPTIWDWTALDVYKKVATSRYIIYKINSITGLPAMKRVF